MNNSTIDISLTTNSTVEPRLHKNSITLFRKTLITVALVLTGLQFLIDSSTENVLCNAYCLLAFIPSCFFVVNDKNKEIGAAITAAIVFLAVLCNSILPMIGTLSEGHSLTYLLVIPTTTYLNRVIFAYVLILAHFVAKSPLSFSIKYPMNKFGTFLRIRSLLPINSIWALMFIGLLAIIFKFLPVSESLKKFFDAFQFLLWIPSVLLLPPYRAHLNRRIRFGLLIYYSSQLLFSVAFNSRMAIAGPIAVIGVGWLVSFSLGMSYINKKMLKNAIIYGFLGLVALGQFSDLSTAIIVERGERNSGRSVIEQISATFNRFLDKKSLEEFRLEDIRENSSLTSNSDWREDYVRNPFLARFIQVKYDDNCFSRVLMFNELQLSQIQQVTKDKLLILLPAPLMRFFGVQLDKKDLLSFSIGDKISELAGGGLGSLLLGSIPAHAFALFGVWYPIMLLLIYFLLFSFIQGLHSWLKGQKGGYMVSTISLLIAFSIYNNICIDSVSVLLAVLFRDFWQIALLYGISLWVIEKFNFSIDINRGMFTSKKRRF